MSDTSLPLACDSALTFPLWSADSSGLFMTTTLSMLVTLDLLRDPLTFLVTSDFYYEDVTYPPARPHPSYPQQILRLPANIEMVWVTYLPWA